MGSPNRVNVVGLHKLNVPQHLLFPNGPALLIGKLVAVNSFKNEAVAIQEHQAVFEFKGPKPYWLLDNFN